MENQTLQQGLASIINEVAPGSVPENPGAGTQPTEPVTPQEPTTQQPTQPETPPQQPENSGIKQLRQQYDTTKQELEQNKQLLERIAASQGISVEQLADKLQADEDKRKATANNIPVEFQQRMREQEEQIRQLQMQNIRANYDSRAAQLRSSYNLTDAQMIEFAEKAKGLGFNVFTPNLDLTTLYRAINYDTISVNLENEIRQKVLAELQNKPANQVSNIPAAPNSNDVSEAEFMKQVFQRLGMR